MDGVFLGQKRYLKRYGYMSAPLKNVILNANEESPLYKRITLFTPRSFATLKDDNLAFFRGAYVLMELMIK